MCDAEGRVWLYRGDAVMLGTCGSMMKWAMYLVAVAMVFSSCIFGVGCDGHEARM